jgi:hypothetical protein
MRRLKLITCYIAMTTFCSSCLTHHHGDTSISISETKDSYSMFVHFDKEKTGEIQRYIDKQIGRANNISFVHTEMNATIMLDDETKFYIKSFPGELKIKFDKTKNSYRSYTEIKRMCMGVKAIIEGK